MMGERTVMQDALFYGYGYGSTNEEPAVDARDGNGGN